MRHQVRNPWLVLITILAASGLSTACTAKDQADPTFKNLDSPAGQRLVWALEATRPGATPEPTEVFVPAFLELIPVSAIVEEVRRIAGETGGLNLVSAWESGEGELTAAAQAANDGTWWQVRVNVEDKEPFGITRLGYNEAPEFGPPKHPDWASFEGQLSEIAGTVSFAAFGLDGHTLHPLLLHNHEAQLSVGSTFKLWVLGALAEQVGQGEAAWSEELPIREEWKSLPSGRMQDLPPGELRTLAEYAVQMISISDNTATDHLIRRIGRSSIEDYAERHGSQPGRNRPFLTTGEFFRLKINAGPELMDQFIRGQEGTRRDILDGPLADLPLPDASQEPDVPTAIDQIEYFASVSALSQLIVDLEELGREPGMDPVLEALTRRPGFEWDRNTWPHIAYKGGSEAGVLNLTWLLQRSDGRRFVMSLTVNDSSETLDQDQIILAAAAAGKLLERG